MFLVMFLKTKFFFPRLNPNFHFEQSAICKIWTGNAEDKALDELSLRPQAAKSKKKRTEFRMEVSEHTEEVARQIAKLVDW